MTPVAVIYADADLDVKGAHVIAAFPSIGLVATIAANFLIERLGLEEVGVMDDDAFPTISVVQDGEPLAPVRVYAGTCPMVGGGEQKLVVFLSEFQPAPELVRPVASAILEWAKANDCQVVVSPEGLVVEDPKPNGPAVFAIGATAAARQVLQDAGVPLFREGIVAGITGVLMNHGRRDGQDVIGLLVEARKEYPDARSAATVIEYLAAVVQADVDTSELHLEADDFEGHVIDQLTRRQRHDEAIESGHRHSVMYG